MIIRSKHCLRLINIRTLSTDVSTRKGNVVHSNQSWHDWDLREEKKAEVIQDIKENERQFVGGNDSKEKPKVLKSAESRLAKKLMDMKTANAETLDDRLLALIRQKVDTEVTSFEQMEHELRGEIASAIGRTATAAIHAIKEAEVMGLVCDDSEPGSIEEEENVHHFKKLRMIAYEKRHQLVIHRQSAGFIFDNTEIVHKAYPLPRLRKVRPKN